VFEATDDEDERIEREAKLNDKERKELEEKR